MFKVKDRQNSCVEPFEFLPAKDSEVYALGEALSYTDKVTKCGATEKPTHGRDCGDTGRGRAERDSDHDKRCFHCDGCGRSGGRVLRLFQVINLT